MLECFNVKFQVSAFVGLMIKVTIQHIHSRKQICINLNKSLQYCNLQIMLRPLLSLSLSLSLRTNSDYFPIQH